MSNLKVGFGRVNITPPMGINVVGYAIVRKAEGVLDELEINAVAVADGKKKAVFISVDNIAIGKAYIEEFKNALCERTGLTREEIFLSVW